MQNSGVCRLQHWVSKKTEAETFAKGLTKVLNSTRSKRRLRIVDVSSAHLVYYHQTSHPSWPYVKILQEVGVLHRVLAPLLLEQDVRSIFT